MAGTAAITGSIATYLLKEQVVAPTPPVRQPSRSENSDDDPSEEQSLSVPRVIDLLSKHGHIVFNEGAEEPEKIVIYLKQFHGGGSDLAEQLKEDTRLCEAFVHHQRSLHRTLRVLLEQYPNNVHFFMEGFEGAIDRWDQKERADCVSLYRTTREAFEGSETRHARLLQITAQQGGTLAFPSTRAMEHFVGYCIAENLERHITGISPDSHDALDALIEDAVKGNTELTISDIQAVTARAFDQQMDLIVQRTDRNVPKNHICVILLGGWHSNHGIQTSVQIGHHDPSLEDRLVKLPTARVIVIDPPGLHALDVMNMPKPYEKLRNN